MSLKKLVLSLSLVTFCLMPLAGCKKDEAPKDPPPPAGAGTTPDGGGEAVNDTSET